MTVQAAINEYITNGPFDYKKLKAYLNDLKKTDPEEVDDAIENVYNLFRGTVNAQNTIYDRRFLYKLSPRSRLRAISSLAFTNIVNYYMIHYSKPQAKLDAWFIQCLRQNRLPHVCQGHLIEYYIIESIISKAFRQEKIQFEVNVIGHDQVVSLVIEDFESSILSKCFANMYSCLCFLVDFHKL